MKAMNIISMFVTTSNESSSFINNNVLAVICDIPVVILWIITLWAKRKTTLAWKTTRLPIAITTLLTILLSGADKALSLPPYNLPLQYYIAWDVNRTMKAEALKSHGKTMGARQHNPADREAYVLFIGESLDYPHLSLAGYPRKTTPLLDARDNLTLYSDYYANSTLTLLSAPMMMSMATADSFMKSYSEKNICQAYKECGFKVFVLVCMNHLDDDAAITADADSVFHLRRDIDIAHVMDSLVSVHPRTFFVAQGLGNHCYFYNFEAEDNVFHPNAIHDSHVKSDSLLYNAYDCTIHYTDRVLDAVINAIDKEGLRSAMLYASDHGENVNPGDERRSVSMNPMKSEYHVPMILWRSNSWIQANPEKHLAITANKDKATGADNLFYTICDLAGITLPKSVAKPQWAVSSPHFQTHQRTLLAPDGKTVRILK